MAQCINEPKRFPAVSDAMGAISLMATVNHSNLTVTSWNMFASAIVSEVNAALGQKERPAINVVYDLAVPQWDTPQGHRLELSGLGPGRMMLDGNVSYALQNGLQPKIVNVGEVRQELVETYYSEGGRSSGAPGGTEERIDKIVSLLGSWNHAIRDGSVELTESLRKAGITPTKKGMRRISVQERGPLGITAVALGNPINKAIMGLRRGQYGLFSEGRAFAPEIPMSSLLKSIANALQELENYGYPFYESPLPGGFKGSGYLKGIDRNGVRQKTEFVDGEFRYADLGNTVAIKKADVYDAMKDGRLLPTMPTLDLAIITGPEIPHLCGSSMIRYAPEYLDPQARWLGLGEGASERFLISTRGQAAFGTRFGKTTIFSAISGYIVHGSERVDEALSSDTYIEAAVNNPQGALFASRR